MSTQVLMPQMGESIAEGTIVTWLKKPGEKVGKDEPLFEISTDKVDAEIPSPAAGYLTKVLFGPGETVEVNKVVAFISDSPGGEEPADKPPAPQPDGSPALSPQSPPTAGKTVQAVEELRRTRSSPLVRKMAQEHNVDISAIQGTGLSGRVTKQDFLKHLEQPPAAAPVRPPAKAATPAKYAYTPQPGDTAEPFSAMRAQIAEHMVISRETSVHVTTVFEVDMTRVHKLRAAHKAKYAERGINLTYMPFIMQAVTRGLREFPVLNSSIVDQTVYHKRDVNLGMAVALDWGLLVPVVKRADELSIAGLARTVNDLAERARGKKLSPDEVSGGTFTITNPGVFGSLFGTPMINQPQVAILGVGTIAKRAVVTDDDAIAVRHMMYLALSFDHRVIDGATADRFMGLVKKTLQEFPEASL